MEEWGGGRECRKRGGAGKERKLFLHPVNAAEDEEPGKLKVQTLCTDKSIQHVPAVQERLIFESEFFPIFFLSQKPVK